MEQDESSIVSQPSLVLYELANYDNVVDEYADDNDLGYYEFAFSEGELISGCSKLTQKYGYPEIAIKKNTKQSTNVKKNNKTKNGSKFPEGVNFPNSHDSVYPQNFNEVKYDVLKLKVIFDRERTGAQDSTELDLKQGDVIAGRYRI